MNTEQRANFDQFFKANHTHSISNRGEPYFSWNACHVCGSTLGGDRYDCDFYDTKAKEIFDCSACIECVYLDATGEELP